MSVYADSENDNDNLNLNDIEFLPLDNEYYKISIADTDTLFWIMLQYDLLEKSYNNLYHNWTVLNDMATDMQKELIHLKNRKRLRIGIIVLIDTAIAAGCIYAGYKLGKA